MRIVVCVKQVIDTAARIDLRGGEVETTGLARVLNPYDEYAIEEAIRIRERKPDTEITLVSVGPEDFRGGINNLLHTNNDAHSRVPPELGKKHPVVSHCLV